MKLKERILVTLSLNVWATILFWFFGTPYFYLLTVLGIGYVIWGGKIHA